LTIEDIRANNNEALKNAIRCGHLKVVEFFIEQGLTSEDVITDSTIISSMAVTDSNVLSFLLSLYKFTPDYLRAYDNYAIKTASYIGSFENVKLLISHGLTLDDIRSNNNVALKNAALIGDDSMIKLLIEQGLTIEDVRSFDNKALKNAIRCGNIENVKLLIDQGLTITDLRPSSIAALGGGFLVSSKAHRQFEMIEFLISQGVTVDDIMMCRTFILHQAAFTGNIKTINFLIEKGLTVDDIRFNNNIALIKAIRFGHIDCLKLLLSHGLTVNDVEFCIKRYDFYTDIETFKFLYETYNFTDFSIFDKIENKDILRYLFSKGYKTDKLRFEDVYLV
jgi:ankyrin repeat protein